MEEIKATEAKEIGNALLDSGKYTQAITYFSKAISINPDDAEVYDLRAIAWCQLLSYDKGIADLKTAVAKDPGFHLAYSHLAEIAFLKQDFSEAEYQYGQALQIEPDNLSYLSNLANTKKALKKNDECLVLCHKILEDYPTNKWALACRADIQMDKRNYQEAINDYTKLSHEDRNNAILYNNIGYAYSKMGVTDEAKNNLQLCIRLKSDFAYAYNNLGYVYYLEDNYKKALELINTSLELDPSNSYAYKNRALVFMVLDDISQATKDLNKAIALGFTEEYGTEVEELLKGIQFLK